MTGASPRRPARAVAVLLGLAVAAAGVAVWSMVLAGGEPSGATKPAAGGEDGTGAAHLGTDPGVVEHADRDEDAVDRALFRAIQANRDLPHGGELTVVSFGEAGPDVSEVGVARDADAVHLARGGWEVGRVDGEAFMRSSDQLLRLGAVEPLPDQLDRLRVKYQAWLGGDVDLDTGPATALHLAERESGALRENLYLDAETGLIVRRETFGADGGPVRLVAYTDVHASPAAVEVPTVTDDGHDHVAVDIDAIVADGRAPRQLPGRFELLAAAEVNAATPAVHLLYGDGLYTLSLFQQDGRMATTAVEGAAELTVAEGGTVWRWPGSEPRRVVWTGAGRTFTVLTDAPLDQLLDAIAGLPVDSSPSILGRISRGITRVGDWLTPATGVLS